MKVDTVPIRRDHPTQFRHSHRQAVPSGNHSHCSGTALTLITLADEGESTGHDNIHLSNKLRN